MKLTLHRETLQSLSDREVQDVAVGNRLPDGRIPEVHTATSITLLRTHTAFCPPPTDHRTIVVSGKG